LFDWKARFLCSGNSTEETRTQLAIGFYAQVAQSVEHVLGKDEVGGSIPLLGFAVSLDKWIWHSF
jgi:hypothetical protein